MSNCSETESMESYKRYLLNELDMSEADADLFLAGFYSISCKKGDYLRSEASGLFIQALDDVDAIELNMGVSDFLAIENSGILQMGLSFFRMNMLRIEQERRNFILKTPKERYLDLLQNNKQVISRVPQHQIATYNGISAEHLSRIRKEILS